MSNIKKYSNGDWKVKKEKMSKIDLEEGALFLISSTTAAICGFHLDF